MQSDALMGLYWVYAVRGENPHIEPRPFLVKALSLLSYTFFSYDLQSNKLPSNFLRMS